MTPRADRWLHWAFGLASLALAALVCAAVAQDWRRPSRIDQRIVPALRAVDRCENCHDRHPGQWLQTHPPERFGCTPCHGGQGLATTAADAHRASPSWLQPLFTPAEQQAACGGCHVGANPPQAPLLQRGRQALRDRGCSACHALPDAAAPDFAPDLAGLPQKTSPAVVRARLRDPASINARHQMPRFELSDRQIEALVAHLWALPPVHLPVPEPLQEGDADRGKAAVAQLRCATCHRIDGRGGDTGPDLALAGMALQPRWLAAWLAATHALQPHSKMPQFTLAAQQIADIVAYAQEQWVSDDGRTPWQGLDLPVQATLAAEGREIFAQLGCGGCHAIGGVRAQPVGAALQRLAERRLADLPAAASGPQPKDLPAWVARKVLQPHAFDQQGADPAKMPQFARLDPQEALAIGVAVAALRPSPVAAAYLRRDDGPPAVLPRGRAGQLVDRYRCLICHQVGGQGGDVARVELDSAGSRLRPQWLERFLRDPLTVRLDQAERMPVLGIGAEEAKLLAAWLVSAQADERMAAAPPITAGGVLRGKALFAEKNCGACHIAQGQGPMKATNLDGACWRLQPGYVYALLREKAALAPHHRHPAAAMALPDPQAADLTAYVLSLPAPWPWPADPQPPADCPLPATRADDPAPMTQE